MENRLQYQLQAFINTPQLWKNMILFDLEQFHIPACKLPEDLSIEKEFPSLKTNYVLGKRMESYFELLLRFSQSWSLLEKNIQIQNGKITIGELDFLLKHSSFKNKIFHVEHIFKFYIYDPSVKEEISRWIGPNRRDSLIKKISKLKQQQFPLIFHPETQKKLHHLDFTSHKIVQKVCFKAQLFLPKTMKNRNLTFINKDCICGYWIKLNAFASEEYGTYKYALPEKQDWPVSPENNKVWISFSEVKEKILKYHCAKKSPLVWVQKNEMVYEKFFIVWW